MTKLRLVWKVGVAGVAIYWVCLAFFAQAALAPYDVKKKVTVTLGSQGKVVVIFSNAQPHNEVIYEMKTDWATRFEQQPQAYVGQSINTPYVDYVAQHRPRILMKYGVFAVAPLLLGAMALGLCRALF
jgi:hypothetical protein